MKKEILVALEGDCHHAVAPIAQSARAMPQLPLAPSGERAGVRGAERASSILRSGYDQFTQRAWLPLTLTLSPKGRGDAWLAHRWLEPASHP